VRHVVQAVLAAAVAAALLFPGNDLGAQPFVPVEVGTTVNGFQDDFNGATLGANWTVAGQSVFSVNGGLLHVSTASGDPNHLLYTLAGYNGTTQEVLARIRVTSFGSGPYSRGGIGVESSVLAVRMHRNRELKRRTFRFVCGRPQSSSVILDDRTADR